jgi:hypothetical protein
MQIRIRIQEVKMTRKNWGKNEEILCVEVLDALFLRAEGSSCSFDVLYGGLG